ncbi:arylamine N-acetyltransferase [Polaribacter sp. R2A056_3_33]|uniref:arylamine N-acetyltransferase n=1 Tax=Polaribacter sp. R2A056_3_33 TaxID=2745563 RepID=UPI001C4E9B34|nr:arylamine N-acetyltransferase [Polaribacter sp. R2A056_3_33]QXP70739.1 arylamine N-acetyltransferase [Polaribacter sp. R2A056_3_33]
MKLSNTEINIFLNLIKINKDLKNVSIDFLNLLSLKVAENIPWQNITMITNGLKKTPTLESIKINMLNGKGGICLDINRFMFYFLSQIGFDVQYILCGRNHKDKRHIAIVVRISNIPYFIDFGDAQPYYQAISLIDNKIIKRGLISYRIKRVAKEYYLYIKKNSEWEIQYVFDLCIYKEVDFLCIIENYYNNIFYGPFWKAVHLAYYPNKKLRAIKGTTILIEDDTSKINKIKHTNSSSFNKRLPEYFDKNILNQFLITKTIKRLKEINLVERFGVDVSKSELDTFLEKIEISKTEISLPFLNKFTSQVLHKIPFQNYKMIERGFNYIPKGKDIKEDMLSLNGGTCATMNIFIGAVLYKLGFNVSLINGTMMKKNDHIAILLNLENKFYTIDLGDGQPYFEPIPIDQNITKEHLFRTFRTVYNSSDLRIDFLIKGKWLTDVTLHLIPKTYKQIYKTLEQHYTQKEFGPFWNGIRFAIYPDKKIIAVRDRIFIVQKNNSIEKIEIKNKTHLKELTTLYLPKFKKKIVKCFTKQKML